MMIVLDAYLRLDPQLGQLSKRLQDPPSYSWVATCNDEKLRSHPLDARHFAVKIWNVMLMQMPGAYRCEKCCAAPS